MTQNPPTARPRRPLRPRRSRSGPAEDGDRPDTATARDDDELERRLTQLLAGFHGRWGPPPAIRVESGGGDVVCEVRVNGDAFRLVRGRRPIVPAGPLSPREQEIVRLIARGFSNHRIARVLEISPWTVSTHLRRVFAKLGVSTRAEAVAWLLGSRTGSPAGSPGSDGAGSEP